MVATEIAEEDQQLEVRIIRTKGGIKNVAYIADNENSLIVQQRTTSTLTPNSDSPLSKNNSRRKEDIEDKVQYPDFSKFVLSKANILNKNSTKTGYGEDLENSSEISKLPSSDIEVEVAVQKVSIKLVYGFIVLISLCKL